jgi:hypothetical protein
MYEYDYKNKQKTNSMVWVRERTYRPSDRRLYEYDYRTRKQRHAYKFTHGDDDNEKWSVCKDVTDENKYTM